MMDEMLNLLPPNVKPDVLFNALFLRRLPAGLRQVLATMKHESQRDLAKAADNLHDSGSAPAVGVSAVPPAQSAEACSLPAANRGQSLPQAYRHRSSMPGRMCYYHARWAEKAIRCTPPCSWSGNGVGGGRNRRN